MLMFPSLYLSNSQDPSQGMVKPTVCRVSHLDKCAGDNSQQILREAHLDCDSRFYQADN